MSELKIPAVGAGAKLDTSGDGQIDGDELKKALPDQAAQAVVDAVKKTQSSEVVVNALEMIMLQPDRSKIGLALLNKAKRFASHPSSTELNLIEGTGYLLHRLEKNAEAKIALQEAIKRGSQFPGVYRLYGYLLAEEEKPKEALAAFLKISPLNAQDRKNIINLSRDCMAIGDDLINEFKGEFKKDKKDRKSREELLSLLLEARSHYEIAKKACEKFLEIMPEDPDASTLLVKLNLKMSKEGVLGKIRGQSI
jgi:tetratricopeptide (TPR) repeat protein